MAVLITFLGVLIVGGWGGYRWGASVERRAAQLLAQGAKKV